MVVVRELAAGLQYKQFFFTPSILINFIGGYSLGVKHCIVVAGIVGSIPTTRPEFI
jgi:hypothetical protein